MNPTVLLAVIVLAATAFVAGCATPPPPPSKADEFLPMYGGQDRRSIPQLKAADDALIGSATKEYGSRASASKRFAAQGFRYYFQDDLPTAMKLFNQAWVLDSDNPNVYWGFASVLNDRQNFCEARKMMERALALGVASAEGLADGGRVNAVCAMVSRSLDQATKATYLKRSHDLYLEALKVSPDNAHVYGSWATASYWMGDYPTAWKYVKKQRALGAKPGDRFLQLLTEKMPEPRD